MAADVPPQIRDQLVAFQQLQQQLSVVATQRQQMEIQLRELEKALEELGRTADDAPIYRSVGALLLRTSGKAGVVKEVTDEKETLAVRVKSLEKQEARLKERYGELSSKIQNALAASEGRGGKGA